MNLQEVNNHLLFKVISGSKAYGLSTPESDEDIRGIFMQPNEFLLGNGYIEQVADDKNDIVFYELNRFLRLASANNPNILEIIYSPKDVILFKDPKMDIILENKQLFLTKQCKKSFGEYAISQIKKAKGLKKKIVNPIDEIRKSPLDFCYYIDENRKLTVPLKDWLSLQQEEYQKGQEYYGVQAMNHGKDLYFIYNNKEKGFYKGIVSENLDSNQLRLSSIPKEEKVVGIVYYNMDGYSSYCVDYKQYWEWVNKRNENRYKNNVKDGGVFDRKNLMHCVRLLDVAIEIAKEKTINVVRPNRDFLLDIKSGKISYDEIMELIDKKKIEMEESFENSDLPESIDPDFIHETIIKFRK